MKIFRYIFPVLAVAVLLSSCSGGKDKVISRRDLAEIYAEMLLTDQWILSHPGNRQIADTSLVYEPILNKYGYTTEDYVRTVDKYMDDPERFSRVVRTTGKILDDMLEELHAQKEMQQEEEEILRYAESIRSQVRVYVDSLMQSLPDLRKWNTIDTVSFEGLNLSFKSCLLKE